MYKEGKNYIMMRFLLTTNTSILFLLAAAAILVIGPSSTNFYVNAELDCSSTKECEDQLRIGSKCVDGKCSNPFVEGCLKTMLGGGGNTDADDAQATEKMINLINSLSLLGALDGRVCNSDDNNDNDEDENSPFCIENKIGYPEIRIFNANWESSIFLAWIKQIMLMEVLKVPVSVGLNSALTNVTGFYSPKNTLEYSSKAYAWEALKTSTNNVACETIQEDCVHVLPEVWNGQVTQWVSSSQEGTIEPVDGCGQVGKIGWYVPSFTAKRDVSLVHYYGLQGEENRAKMAETFKRPTTWIEYCDEVSPDNCTTPDSVAQGYPSDLSETIKYFHDGSYTGYFRMLPENNCTEFPTTCTGYMIAPQCTWSTTVDAQIYWNDMVGLAQDGPLMPNKAYNYASEIEIWRAANATKSDVMFWWWTPEPLVEEFSKSEAKFQQVLLPTSTDVCFRNSIEQEDRCSKDIAVRRGNELGSCDAPAHALQKVIASSLVKQTMSQTEASRSPG